MYEMGQKSSALHDGNRRLYDSTSKVDQKRPAVQTLMYQCTSDTSSNFIDYNILKYIIVHVHIHSTLCVHTCATCYIYHVHTHTCTTVVPQSTVYLTGIYTLLFSSTVDTFVLFLSLSAAATTAFRDFVPTIRHSSCKR